MPEISQGSAPKGRTSRAHYHGGGGVDIVKEGAVGRRTQRKSVDPFPSLLTKLLYPTFKIKQ